jgi:DNA-binding NarL/FixJ family response regulator
VKVPALLLADDNLALLKALVEMLTPRYQVVAALPNGRAALDQVFSLNPDILLLDISLGDMSGFDVAAQLNKLSCPARIIFLSMHEDVEFLTAAFDMGAAGYVFKSRIGRDLTKAIDCVFSGGRFYRECTVSAT